MIVILLAAIVVVLLVTGLVARRRRDEAGSGSYTRHVAEADSALERARASDKGWDRGSLERAAREALAERGPDGSYDDLHLVLVEDRPGVDEDLAHLVATGASGNVRVVLGRRDGAWVVERLDGDVAPPSDSVDQA